MQWVLLLSLLLGKERGLDRYSNLPNDTQLKRDRVYPQTQFCFTLNPMSNRSCKRRTGAIDLPSVVTEEEYVVKDEFEVPSFNN